MPACKERQSLRSVKIRLEYFSGKKTTKQTKRPTKPTFELCFHNPAQTLPTRVPRKYMNESSFGKDCKYVWYRQGLRVHCEGTLFCAIVNSNTSHFGTLKLLPPSLHLPWVVFMKLRFWTVYMCVHMCMQG